MKEGENSVKLVTDASDVMWWLTQEPRKLVLTIFPSNVYR